jgi:hypothetical protein
VSVVLPRLPDRGLLADLCREAAAREKVQPQLVEKDFYLTRLLWAVGQELGDQLLLKGGTLFSKVDLGFFRMSEDADFVFPGEPAKQRLSNVRHMNLVRDALKVIAPAAGVTVLFPAGELFDRGAHCVWQLDYPSEFGRQGVRFEVSIRPVLRAPRKVKLSQLLDDPLLEDWKSAWCFALDEDEARAEKVRAAFTREAIRDFYDLDRLHEIKADLSSKPFIALVDKKLAELGVGPMAQQARSFGLVGARRRKLENGLRRELTAMLRADAPAFDLEKMVARFDKLWNR